jgi:hypothetical protein
VIQRRSQDSTAFASQTFENFVCSDLPDEQEKRRRSRLDCRRHVFHPFVIDANVGQLIADGTRCRSDSSARQRHQKDQSNQRAPKGSGNPVKSVVGRAEIRRGRRGTAETHEYDTPVLVEGRGSTTKLGSCVIGGECFLVSSQACERDAQLDAVASAGLARDPFVFSERPIPLCCLLPVFRLYRAFCRLREPLCWVNWRQVIRFKEERLGSFRIPREISML